MSHIFTKAAVAALVAFGAIGASSAANAAQVDVVIKAKPLVVVKPAPVVVVKPAAVVVKPAAVVVKPAPVVVVKPVGRCAPALALQKASNHGLNKVAISNVGPNRVVVSGKSHGVWAKMVFANVHGCPRL